MKRKVSIYTRLFFLIFRHLCCRGGGAKNCPKKYNIDYFGYAANLEVKFKLNFDEERGSKIEKKVKIPRKI
jgi:hypothetical protein